MTSSKQLGIPGTHSPTPGAPLPGSRLWGRRTAVLVLVALVPFAGHGQAASGSATPFDQLAAQAAEARTAGDLPRAIGLYRQAVGINPAWPDGWWYLGSLRYGTGDYANARDALTHYIQLTPAAGPATALRGLCEYEIADYRQALIDIEAGLAHGAATDARNEHILRAHEALLLTRNGLFWSALQTYAFFAHDGPPSPDMAMGIGLAGLRTPLLPSELASDQQQLYLDTGNALFLFLSGDKAGFSQAFQTLFQRYPAAPNLHFIYGYYTFGTDPDQATAEFKRELEVDPSNASAGAMLAWAAIMHDDPASALPYAQRAVQADPTLPLAQLVLGRAMTGTGDIPTGIVHLEKALELDPGNLENHIALAKAYSEAGRKEDARRERQQALALTAEGPVAQP